MSPDPRPQRPEPAFAERPLVTLPNYERRAVFTGLGVVAPNGQDLGSWWEATKAGKSGIDRISHFDPAKYDTQLAGEVQGFSADDHIERRMQVQTDHWTHMALAATDMALADAEIEPFEQDPYSISVITASSSGGNAFGQKEIQALWAKGPGFVGAYQSIAWFYAATTGQISIRHNLMGPCGVVVAEGAGGLEALQHSRRTIRRGIDTIISGGLEAPIGPYALSCQMGNGCLSKESDPAAAYRPFDRRANGYVPGEGGAILMLEAAESAKERGAPQVYGEIAGYGATNDASHHSRPAPDGSQLARAIRIALDDAGIEPDDVDVVFADAAGVPEADAAEAAAIKQALGDRAANVPVTAPKSMVGRLYAGGAPLDVAAALLSLRDGVIPPTINLDEPADGCDLNFVTGSALEGELGTALVLARGFGGFNGALIVRRAD
ncbi:MAG: ketosynthase chain-length factor [Solirubrobacterales bacterium]